MTLLLSSIGGCYEEQECIDTLRNGGIVAIKGIGGFHIACDATNEKAVRRLRERKRKSNKPFGVMMPDVDTISRFCEVSEAERGLLESGRRPIVLLRKKGDHGLSDAVSPNNKYLGCMLPYTPLHYLLFDYPDSENPPHSPFFKGGREDCPPLAKGGGGGI